ncbi:MAG: electron transport complex subunit E [candidate division WOR-3 bacterium]|nr:electron transport complex subunit E [candidate division WOR-3 bacterium]
MSRTFIDGIIKNNLILVLAIGLCPTLAVTTSAYNGLGMGLAATFVLIFSNLIISAFRNIIPDNLRIPIFIVIIATFVTVVDYTLKAYVPFLSVQLGVFVPLIVVNCGILGRVEGFAYDHSPGYALMDGLGIGLGFTIILFVMGTIREILGQGIWLKIPGMFSGFKVFGEAFTNSSVILMILPPGGFLTIALLMGIFNLFRRK